VTVLFDSLTAQVGLMLGLMALAMTAAGLLIGDLSRSYAVGFWGRRAVDHGAEPALVPAYQGAERRQHEPVWIDTLV
jgi:hypothetical protein